MEHLARTVQFWFVLIRRSAADDCHFLGILTDNIHFPGSLQEPPLDGGVFRSACHIFAIVIDFRRKYERGDGVVVVLGVVLGVRHFPPPLVPGDDGVGPGAPASARHFVAILRHQRLRWINYFHRQWFY